MLDDTRQSPAPTLGGSYGYAFEGDEVDLNAEVQFTDEDVRLALQLWASSGPWEGGAIEGVKVAEVGLNGGVAGVRHVNATVPASPPAGTGDYAMVLVLAGRDGRPLSVANFPRRESFPMPRLGGEVSYAIEGNQLVLTAGTIANPRQAGGLSGQLSLELWALEQPYDGGAFSGCGLGAADVGQVFGQSSLVGCRYVVPITPPPVGNWHLVVMLREWVGLSFHTRDYTNFPHPVSFPLAAAPAPAPEEHTPAHAERPASLEVHASVQQCADAVPVAVPALAAAAVMSPARTAAAGTVSVNGASLADLQAVKGLPKAAAAAIVAGRPWSSLDDLVKVKGMGQKLLARIRPAIGL